MARFSPFCYFKTSPNIIYFVVIIYGRIALLLWNVEDLLNEWLAPKAIPKYALNQGYFVVCKPPKCLHE